MKNDGKFAERWFENNWASFGKQAYCARLADHHKVKYQGGVKNVAVISGTNPSDYVVCCEGVTFFAEVKSTVNATSFSFDQIEPSQWKAARQTVAANGLYFFYLLALKTEEWFKVPASMLLEMKDSGRKSVKWTELPYQRIFLVDKPTK